MQCTGQANFFAYKLRDERKQKRNALLLFLIAATIPRQAITAGRLFFISHAAFCAAEK
ncbi:MAG: hypothetical protein KH354_03285 [Clostridiales bacterium]|nr:hypothetical protein [Clostridiales bacterium]